MKTSKTHTPQLSSLSPASPQKKAKFQISRTKGPLKMWWPVPIKGGAGKAKLRAPHLLGGGGGLEGNAAEQAVGIGSK